MSVPFFINGAEMYKDNCILVNTSRCIHKSPIRRVQHGRDRSQVNIIVGGGAVHLRPGRPVSVSGKLVLRYIDELVGLEKRGMIEVFDYMSNKLDLCMVSRHREAPAYVAEEAPAYVAEEAPKEDDLISASTDVVGSGGATEDSKPSGYMENPGGYSSSYDVKSNKGNRRRGR